MDYQRIGEEWYCLEHQVPFGKLIGYASRSSRFIAGMVKVIESK